MAAPTEIHAQADIRGPRSGTTHTATGEITGANAGSHLLAYFQKRDFQLLIGALLTGAAASGASYLLKARRRKKEARQLREDLERPLLEDSHPEKVISYIETGDVAPLSS